MIIHPEEELDIMALLSKRPDVQVVHREPGLDEDTLLYVRCADEEEKEGLERAWMSYRRFRRMLPPRGGNKG